MLAVDVVEEQVERANALAQPGLDVSPFVGRDDPRHQVEGEGALAISSFGSHREGDAARPLDHLAKHDLAGEASMPICSRAVRTGR